MSISALIFFIITSFTLTRGYRGQVNSTRNQSAYIHTYVITPEIPNGVSRAHKRKKERKSCKFNLTHFDWSDLFWIQHSGNGILAIQPTLSPQDGTPERLIPEIYVE